MASEKDNAVEAKNDINHVEEQVAVQATTNAEQKDETVGKL